MSVYDQDTEAMPTCNAPGWRDGRGMVACPFPFDHDGPHSWQRPLPPPIAADPAIAEGTLSAVLAQAWAEAKANGHGRYGVAAAQVAALCEYIERLHALVRWFDLAYGDNTPVWLFENVYGQPLPANVAMHETYEGVIGDKTPR